MEPWTPSDEWIARINKARRFFNRPKVIMVTIVFNWIIVAVSMFFALRDGDGRWLMMAIFWTIFAAYIGPRQYAIAKAEEDGDDEDDDGVAGDAKRAVAPVDAAETNKSDDGGMIARSGESDDDGAAEGDEFRKTAASGESKCDESKEDNK